MILPDRLRPGDMVAIVSPSWGGPSVFPHIYDNGLKVLRAWGLDVREFPTAREDAAYLSANPRARAADINAAFADPSIKAVFASIGGDDSMRILPYLDRDVIAANPKILMGYSDTTTLHTYLALLGMVSFYGPAIMAGFSQMDNLPQSYKAHVHDMLFSPADRYAYTAETHYANHYPDWSDPANTGKVAPMAETDGWRVLQGQGKVVTGTLFGGCIEVLEFLKATPYWPQPAFWDGKILFLETSEEKPGITQVGWMLRNYGLQGVFDRVSGVMFGRARDYSPEEKKELDQTICRIIGTEFSRPDLPVMSNMDFGHTDPQIVLPIGATARMDMPNRGLSLTAPWLR